MVQVSVQPKGIGYLLKVGFPAVKKDGFGFDAISAEYPLTLGKAVDAAWIKAHAKPLEAEVTRSMRVDFEQIERFLDRLLDEDVMAKTLRSALGKGETDEKKRQAKAEALAVAAVAAMEFLEHHALLFGRDTWAAVVHADCQLFAVATHAEQHATTAGVADGVGEEVL